MGKMKDNLMEIEDNLEWIRRFLTVVLDEVEKTQVLFIKHYELEDENEAADGS